MKQESRVIPTITWQCDCCPQTFNTFTQLMKHRKKHRLERLWNWLKKPWIEQT